MVRRLSATSLARRSRLDADRRRAAASAFSAVGRYLVNRLRARARRRLVGATPRRRVCDEVSVTGRVVRGRERGGRRLLTGPRFVVRADTT
ncbi:hypothetical protein [Haloferax massiliensis]|uniref:hypothetical protein n=1 Tax=Haloferax massiliensis TaxID=1476858 RepID=UPI000AF1ECF2|nr:hypothetical protein [Haloferax massiliensis]